MATTQTTFNAKQLRKGSTYLNTCGTHADIAASAVLQDAGATVGYQPPGGDLPTLWVKVTASDNGFVWDMCYLSDDGEKWECVGNRHGLKRAIALWLAQAPVAQTCPTVEQCEQTYTGGPAGCGPHVLADIVRGA